MMFRKVLLAVAFISLSSMALATSGTPQEQAACSPDVRKFCQKGAAGLRRQRLSGMSRK